MIKRLQVYFSGVKPVFIDGMLYVWIAVLTSIATSFSSDDAAKYMSPQLLFWLKMTIGAISAGVVSIKMFRSTSFADHKEEKKRTGNTQIFTQ